ncbi:MAG: triose-phosphate isomerase [Francisellaceae bacterium]|jgi:triosephosphate isomerase (TIM)|nr:triose-phosphate isomerase [Francisellaceae bacterium]MBT6538824.1 triose-phosphate isomerase [Francisellaceae bacterium]
MRKPLVVANWKMNGSLKFIKEYFLNFDFIPNCEVVICPPYPYLSETKVNTDRVGFLTGAQDMYFQEKGAFTGAVGASMLCDFGCSYVILGHSERRSLFHDGDKAIAAKLLVAVEAGIVPILCVGESQAQRDNGSTIEVISSQLQVVKDISASSFVIAYEPIWAIGTGKSASADDADEVHAAIRTWLANNISEDKANVTKVLYGGSVKANNAQELFAKSNIDGALIGGASLVADEFMKICSMTV